MQPDSLAPGGLAARILIAEHDPHARSALRVLLEQEPDLRVVGEVGSAFDLLPRVRHTRPRVVLFAWELPRLDAGALVAGVRACCPGVALIALSVRPETRRLAIAQGVDHFVCKGDAPDRLLLLLRQLVSHPCEADSGQAPRSSG
jgi:DNA-binding NarL/FixJ family response regulator